MKNLPGPSNNVFMNGRIILSLLGCILFFVFNSHAQAFNKTLVKADKLYILKNYAKAATHYEKYLVKHPKDFYASRQAALCYDALDNPNMAIDHWPDVFESSAATDRDKLAYAKCLMANFRVQDARGLFVLLASSTDKSIAEWGKAYLNSARFYADSELVKVYEVPGIKTPGSQYRPAIVGEKLYFISADERPAHDFRASTDKPLLKLFSASRTDSLHVTAPFLFKEPRVRNLNGSFCFSGDGATVYLSVAVSSKDLGLKGVEPFYRFQLYSLPATGEGNRVSFKYNSPDYDILQPCLNKEGNRLYFASNRKGSLGGMDLFVCELVNGEWTEPVNLGPGVNTAGNEVFPHLGEDGRLYFASDGRPGLGGLDIFTAKPQVDHPLFEIARNAGSPINTPFDDFAIFTLLGGKTGYLSSNRNNAAADVIFFFRNSKPQ